MRVLAEIAKGVTVEIDNDDGKIALRQAIDLANKWCHVCADLKEDFRLLANEYDDIIYVKRKCHDCGAQSNLGSFKAGGFFWKKFEIYVESPESSEPAQATMNEMNETSQPVPAPDDPGF